jgi:hypothetical protein
VTIDAAARTTRSTRSNRSTEWVPFALLTLVVAPAITGWLRLIELAGGPHFLPANPRLTASRVPLVVHIVSALGYAVLGAFQFSAAINNRSIRVTARVGSS